VDGKKRRLRVASESGSAAADLTRPETRAVPVGVAWDGEALTRSPVPARPMRTRAMAKTERPGMKPPVRVVQKVTRLYRETWMLRSIKAMVTIATTAKLCQR
jgi:hypothetical protein